LCKGIRNPCYELGSAELHPVTEATTTSTSASATTAAAATESYRTGFANPMFDETVKLIIRFGCRSISQSINQYRKCLHREGASTVQI